MLKKIFILSLVFTMLTASLCPSDAFAGRSWAGGGELAKFDFGKWAIGTGIGVASFTLGSAIGAGFENIGNVDPSNYGFFGGFKNNIFNLGNWAANFNIYAATKQMNRAIGAIGMYCGWDPKATLFIGSVLTSMAAGGLNSGFTMGKTHIEMGLGLKEIGPYTGLTVPQGMLSGAIQGSVEGGIIAAAANKNGEVEPWVGALAGLAGSFAGGTYEGSIGNGLSQGLGVGLSRTLASIPAAGIRIGEGYLIRGTKDRWNQYIISQSFSGLYPLVGAMTQRIMGIKSNQNFRFGGVMNDSAVINAQQFSQPDFNDFQYRQSPQPVSPPRNPVQRPGSNIPRIQPGSSSGTPIRNR